MEGEKGVLKVIRKEVYPGGWICYNYLSPAYIVSLQPYLQGGIILRSSGICALNTAKDATFGLSVILIFFTNPAILISRGECRSDVSHMRTLRTSTKNSKHCPENSKEVKHPIVQSLSYLLLREIWLITPLFPLYLQKLFCGRKMARIFWDSGSN